MDAVSPPAAARRRPDDALEAAFAAARWWGAEPATASWRRRRTTRCCARARRPPTARRGAAATRLAENPGGGATAPDGPLTRHRGGRKKPAPRLRPTRGEAHATASHSMTPRTSNRRPRAVAASTKLRQRAVRETPGSGRRRSPAGRGQGADGAAGSDARCRSTESDGDITSLRERVAFWRANSSHEGRGRGG